MDSILIILVLGFSGKEVHSMVAHLDAVTSLSIDPSGLYILSGSKYLLHHFKSFYWGGGVL